jgi:regulation of enolase protein 1 (concanavalin A-like superfamily)
VWGDGVKLYDSGTMTQTSATKSVSVDVSNVTQLTLTVTDAGDGISYDHADWAAARLQSPSASQPPAAPTGLTATAVSPTQINVTWNDVINESGYRVERSTDGTNFSPVGTTAANVVSFADTTVSGSALYYYRVIATSASGDSSPSNVDTARPLQPPSAPSNLAASAVSANQINLSWVINDTNTEENFKIERSPNGTSGWVQIASVPDTSTYSDTTVAGSTTYFYRVRASNTAGDSGYSNVASATTPAATTSPTLIATGATWKYLDNGSNQGTAWRALAFDDSTWKSGAAQLGYGDGDEATVVSFGSNANNKFVTTYFRRNFSVADKTQVTALSLKLLRDDGAVVYLNGTEIYRSNMPTGTISSSTFASTAVGGADESTFFSASVSPSLLLNGNNVIAVEIHQSDAASSDISFDFGLTATLSSGGTSVPSAPSGLTATAASSNQINLAWVDTSSTETGFNVYRSTDGTTFTKVGSAAAGATSYSDTSGLVASTKYYYKIRAFNSGGESVDSSIASATTLAGTTSLPAPWVDADVGSVGVAGSASFDGTTYTVKGSGADIWTSADGFHFVYQQLTGDGTIIARVTGVQNTNGWAKAGVMIRESLAAGAKEASVHVTPANGVVMTFRTTTGGTSDGFFTSGLAPQWLKLTRSGSTFTSYKSSDGVTWSQVGTLSITMPSTVYIGLDVSSKANTTLNTSTFTNVSITAGTPALAPATTLATSSTATTTSSSTKTKKNDLLDLLA